MVKRRPVIVISKPIVSRPNLCTIIPLSTTKPEIILPLHYQIALDPPLPSPYDAEYHWVKGDMVYALSFCRFSYPFIRKDKDGKRIYDNRTISMDQLNKIQKCVMAGIGIMKY